MNGYHVYCYDSAERDCCSEIRERSTLQEAIEECVTLSDRLEMEGFTMTRSGGTHWVGHRESMEVSITVLDGDGS